MFALIMCLRLNEFEHHIYVPTCSARYNKNISIMISFQSTISISYKIIAMVAKNEIQLDIVY